MKIRRSPTAATAGRLLAAVLCWTGWFGPVNLHAASAKAQEDKAYVLALSYFRDSHYPIAERAFGEFLVKYTNSVHKPDAILYMARARLEQSNYEGAVGALQSSSATADGLLSDYIFWIAQARYASGDLARAAEGFSRVAKNFPLSPLRLDASVDEAEAHFRTGDWPVVVQLLEQRSGPFQSAAAENPKSDVAIRGWLLLGEALLHENRAADGEKVILGLDPAGFPQALKWRREYLLCQLQLAGGRPKDALATTTNLLAQALDAQHEATSIFLQGQVLEKLARPSDALQVYATNFSDSQPAETQREAAARMIELTVALNPLPQAIQAIEALAAQHPQSPAQDLAHVSLGELYLKASVSTGQSNAPAPADMNLLTNALTNLNLVVTVFTNSPLMAKARLGRGWCDWLATLAPNVTPAGLNSNLLAARADFQEAADHLPFSSDQAVARFKLADAQFSLKDYPNAATNYGLVVQRYAQIPEVTNSLYDLALYQMAESDILRGDEDGARAAVASILQRFPGNYYGERGSLLIGEDLNRKFNYAKAREVFNGLIERSPHSSLRPQVESAIARTYDYEGQWSEAIGRYKDWAANHRGDALLPEIEFHLALASGKAGLTNDALSVFTNFPTRFPASPFIPWALNWVADYYYDQGDYISAEKNYQELYKCRDAGDLAFQALFWAGKSAMARQGNGDAQRYFTNLLSMTNAPAGVVARGYFALGDSYFQQFLDSPTNRDYLVQAINAIRQATNGAPTNEVSVEALGRMGDYYMQWAQLNPTPANFAVVTNMYESVLGFPEADVPLAARSQALVGLGLVALQQNGPDVAEEYFYKVLYSEPFDAYWVERAGEYAAGIYDQQQNWKEEITVYDRMLARLPALRSVIEKKRAAAQAHLSSFR